MQLESLSAVGPFDIFFSGAPLYAQQRVGVLLGSPYDGGTVCESIGAQVGTSGAGWQAARTGQDGAWLVGGGAAQGLACCGVAATFYL